MTERKIAVRYLFKDKSGRERTSAISGWQSQLPAMIARLHGSGCYDVRWRPYGERDWRCP